MATAVVTALITGGLSLIGTIITVVVANSRLTHEIVTRQSVQDTKIEELTREVRAHNGFAERIPRIEQRIEYLEKEIDRRGR